MTDTPRTPASPEKPLLPPLEDAAPVEEKRLPHRPETVRMVLYAFVALTAGIVGNLLYGLAAAWLYAGGCLPLFTPEATGNVLTWGYALFAPLSALLVSRRLVFRSRGNVWLALLVMAVLAVVWKLWTGNTVSAITGAESGAAYMGAATAIDALWLAVQYLFQRLVIFRSTLDTL